MAKMDFIVKEYGCLMHADGKTSFIMVKDSFGPTQLFAAGIGG